MDVKSITRILKHLTDIGVSVKVVSDKLSLIGPTKLIPPELLAEIRLRKNELIELLSTGSSIKRDLLPMPNKSTSEIENPLVFLRRGTKGNILCYTGAEGFPGSLSNLAHGLSSDVSFTAVIPQCFISDKAEVISICEETLATIENNFEISNVLFVGYSAGGTFMIETVRLIQKKYKNFRPTILLIDSIAPQFQSFSSSVDELIIGFLEQYALSLLNLNFETIDHDKLEPMLKFSLAKYESLDEKISSCVNVLCREGFFSESKHEFIDFFTTYGARYVKTLKCFREFKCELINCDAVVVAAEDGGFLSAKKQCLGYSSIIKGKIKTHKIAGTHQSILKNPQVVELIKILEDALLFKD